MAKTRKRKANARSKRRSSWQRTAAGWLLRLLAFFVLSTLAVTLVYKFVPVPYTLTMLDRRLNGEGRLGYDWTPIERISPEMALAVVASEDQRFPQHFGFDFDAMGDAYQNNQRGRRIKGASTISQQVAKNVFLWQGRSYFRKALEVWFTLLIEIFWGKGRILEVYLNVAETGPMTFGVEAAARRYFHIPAADLSRPQAALMAVALPNPNRYLIDRPSGYMQVRAGKIRRQMRALGGTNYLADL